MIKTPYNFFPPTSTFSPPYGQKLDGAVKLVPGSNVSVCSSVSVSIGETSSLWGFHEELSLFCQYLRVWNAREQWEIIKNVHFLCFLKNIQKSETYWCFDGCFQCIIHFYHISEKCFRLNISDRICNFNKNTLSKMVLFMGETNMSNFSWQKTFKGKPP